MIKTVSMIKEDDFMSCVPSYKVVHYLFQGWSICPNSYLSFDMNSYDLINVSFYNV